MTKNIFKLTADPTQMLEKAIEAILKTGEDKTDIKMFEKIFNEMLINDGSNEEKIKEDIMRLMERILGEFEINIVEETIRGAV